MSPNNDHQKELVAIANNELKPALTHKADLQELEEMLKPVISEETARKDLQQRKNNSLRHRRRVHKFFKNKTYRKVPTIQK